MPDIHLSMATGDYDHFRDIFTGRVRPAGIELTAMQLPIEEIFFRTFSSTEWDISEFSFAKYVSMLSTGTAPFRAIPVFPSRVFRHSAFYVRAGGSVREPQDLAGKRIGVAEWAQTAGIYARALLQHEYGVRLSDIRWVQAGVNEPGRSEKVKPVFPSGVEVQPLKDRSLNEMLLSGELDAVISAREPAAFMAGDSRIVRLWPKSQEMEEAYYKKTGIFPIMHAMVVSNDVLAANPWVAANLYRAFQEAKTNSLRRLRSIVHSPIPVPWTQNAYTHAREVLGDDFWPYGLEPNRATLTAFLGFCHEQGISARRVSIEELFSHTTAEGFRV